MRYTPEELRRLMQPVVQALIREKVPAEVIFPKSPGTLIIETNGDFRDFVTDGEPFPAKVDSEDVTQEYGAAHATWVVERGGDPASPTLLAVYIMPGITKNALTALIKEVKS